MGLSHTSADFAAGPAPADVVRRQYLASAAGDLEALRATLAPDVEWTEMAGFPLAALLPVRQPKARGAPAESLRLAVESDQPFG